MCDPSLTISHVWLMSSINNIGECLFRPRSGNPATGQDTTNKLHHWLGLMRNTQMSQGKARDKFCVSLGAEGIRDIPDYGQFLEDCRFHRERIRCPTASLQLGMTVLWMVWAFVYFAMYFFYISRAVYTLRRLPRQEHKLAHLTVNLQACAPLFIPPGFII